MYQQVVSSLCFDHKIAVKYNTRMCVCVRM